MKICTFKTDKKKFSTCPKCMSFTLCQETKKQLALIKKELVDRKAKIQKDLDEKTKEAQKKLDEIKTLIEKNDSVYEA